jgi:hypothetical protein
MKLADDAPAAAASASEVSNLRRVEPKAATESHGSTLREMLDTGLCPPE